MLDKGEVKEVKILDTHINFKSKDKNNVIYKAGLIRDEKLVDRLLESKVQFSSDIPSKYAPLLSIFLQFVLPFIIIFGFLQ